MNDNVYTLRDLQGGVFGEKRILQGEKEVFETFREWAESDEMEDPTLKNWSFGELIAVWNINILKLDWETLAFRELNDEELAIKNEIKEEKAIFRYINDKKEVCEYRFTDGVCDGFFCDDIKLFDYEGKKLTEIWKQGMKEASFIEIN